MRRFKCGDAEAEFAEGLKEVAPNRPAIHMARALGIASSSASGLLSTTSQPLQLDAAKLAQTLRGP